MLRCPSNMLKCEKCGATNLKEGEVIIFGCSECGRPYFKHIECGGILKTDQSKLSPQTRVQKME